MIYTYETYTTINPKNIVAENDEEALGKLRRIFGEFMESVIKVYEHKNNEERIVWEEIKGYQKLIDR